MSLLYEAFRAGFQPCSYSLLILALLVIGLRGKSPRLPALGIYYAAAVVFAWIPFIGVNPVVDGRWAGTAALIGGLVLIGRKRSAHGLSAAGSLTGAAMVGAFAGATWVPCVGPELGAVLTAALTDPGPGLVGLALYLLGVMWMAWAAAAAADCVSPVRRILEGRTAMTVFRVLGGLIATTVAFDLYPPLLSRLARLSSL